jgi:uncharacterized protein (UPF0333 family)
LKRKTPGGIWALRIVTIAIAVIVVVVIGTIAYSAYEDYTVVRSELAGGSNQATALVSRQGSGETVSLNITFSNKGFYTLNVSVTCAYPDSNVVCQPAKVSVAPGQQGVLRFRMTVADYSLYQSSSDKAINGTVSVSLEPLVTLTIGTDFSSAVNGGGS